MPEKFNQYYLTKTLSKKYSHVTYLASPVNEPEYQVVLTVFSSFLFRFPHERENILQRAQCLKKIQNEHIVNSLDMGVEEEQPFIVRDYLPNSSLRKYLKQLSPGRLPLQKVLEIVLQIGEALTSAHQQNIVHGNIKPENIFLDADGQVRLADFYLVDRKDAIIRDQVSEEYAFCYLAPEQFAGLTDERSDQYALGCLSYELITGQVPFVARSLVSMMGQTDTILPAPLSERRANLPPFLEAAVLKTLARDPAERFLDFSLFLEAIRSALLPSPAFPLAQATEAESIPFPIRRQDIPALAISQPSEVLENAEFEAEYLFFEPASFTREEADELLLLDASTKQEDNALLIDTFGKADPSSVITSGDSIFGQHKYEIEEMSPSLESPSQRSRPLTRRTQRSRKKQLAFLFLLLGVTTSVIYAATLPMNRIIKPRVTAYRTPNMGNLVVQHNEHVLPARSPRQTPQISIVQLPTHTNSTPIVQATQVEVIVPAHSSRQAQSLPTTHSSSVKPMPTSIPISMPAPTPTPANSSITYEAEASQNTLSNGAQVLSCSSCSGGYRVGALGLRTNGADGMLRFNNVNKDVAGKYTLTLYYSNGSRSDRDLDIRINGGAVIVFTGSPTGSFTTFATAYIAVTLNAGNNTITFDNPQAVTLDIDKIIV